MADPKNFSEIEECDNYIENVKDEFPELVKQARLRSIEIRVEAMLKEFSVTCDVEREILTVLFAYEDALREKNNGKRVSASRLRQKIKKYGLIAAAESAVSKPHDPIGYQTLMKLGLTAYTFEAVVLRPPRAFSETAVKQAQQRLTER